MELFNRAFFGKFRELLRQKKSGEDFQCYWKWFIGAKADDVKIQKSIFENSNFVTLSCRRLIANFCSGNLNPLRKKKSWKKSISLQKKLFFKHLCTLFVLSNMMQVSYSTFNSNLVSLGESWNFDLVQFLFILLWFFFSYAKRIEVTCWWQEVEVVNCNFKFWSCK